MGSEVVVVVAVEALVLAGKRQRVMVRIVEGEGLADGTPCWVGSDTALQEVARVTMRRSYDD